MGWLLRVAVRLAPLRKLKARRCELLLEKQDVMNERRRFLASSDDAPRRSISYLAEKRINAQLDAINAEIGRRRKS